MLLEGGRRKRRKFAGNLANIEQPYIGPFAEMMNDTSANKIGNGINLTVLVVSED